jgi:hypothetical protein
VRVTPLVAVVAAVAAGCTGGGEAADTPSHSGPGSSSTNACPAFVLERHGGNCVDTFELGGHVYRVACAPVPEILLDVPLGARWGRAVVRAVAAVPPAHAVAVTANDGGCGDFALALRNDLPEEVAAAIVHEVERAASLPPDLEK